MKAPLLSIVTVFAAGCALHDAPAEVAEVEQHAAGSECPIWRCGANSPEIAGHGFHELHEGGALNAEGFRILSFKRYGVAYGVDVQGGKLRGIDAGGNIVLEGSDLEDAQLLVGYKTGAKYLVEIKDVATGMSYWATLPRVSTQPTLESYVLEWVPTADGVNPAPRTEWVNVCSEADTDDTNPEYLGMQGEFSVLFEGDRIDAAAKTVAPALDDSWFNIGCAGHALAKLHLSGHTGAAHSAGFETTIPERQAMLKMFVADYCGTGMPFTVAGEALSWADDKRWMDHPPKVQIEARWTADGAACLDKPRLVASPSWLGTQTFPGGVEAAIASTCKRPPACTNDDPYDLAGFHLVSANP